MRTANEYEIAIFKKEYCKNGEARISIGKDFEVDVESFEELLPGKIVSSYATGNRDIENSFIMFRVCDVIKDIQYFPVFSETIGRKMLKSWNKPVPRKKQKQAKENKKQASMDCDCCYRNSCGNFCSMRGRNVGNKGKCLEDTGRTSGGVHGSYSKTGV